MRQGFCVFFFQAEDGIRDSSVTGVQTCALPILTQSIAANEIVSAPGIILYTLTISFAAIDWVMSLNPSWVSTIYGLLFVAGQLVRSEERRVGERVDLGGRRIIKKKKSKQGSRRG